MKKIILLCLLSFQSFASDLIYKQGFESTALVSGTVTGLVASGLTINLNVGANNEVLSINNDGVFTFFMDVDVTASFTVRIVTYPDSPQQQNCSLTNETGIMLATGVSNLTVVCNQNAWNWDEMNWDNGSWN